MVNYAVLDSFKRNAQDTAASLNFGLDVFEASRGESAFVFKKRKRYYAMVLEGLGTKNLIAEISEVDPEDYVCIGIDSAATILNDLATVGAKPDVITCGIMSADDYFFQNYAEHFLKGWKQACEIAQVEFGGGETQQLDQIILPSRTAVFGSAFGTIGKRKNLITDENLSAGDVIIGVASSGVHANGLTDIRRNAMALRKDLIGSLSFRELKDQILIPSEIYSPVIQELRLENLKPNYVVNITGHGFNKIMRSRKPFTYLVDNLIEPLPNIFKTIISSSAFNSHEKLFTTFNMGVGYVLFVSPEKVRDTLSVLNWYHVADVIGRVVYGPRSVRIRHTFSFGESVRLTLTDLDIRVNNEA